MTTALRNGEREDPAAHFCAAVRAVVTAKQGVAPQFFVFHEDAASILGNALMFDADPAHFTWNLPFTVKVNGTATRVCRFFLGAGDWSKIRFDFRKEAVFREMEDILARGGWSRDMPAYRPFQEKLELGRPVTRNGVPLDSLEKIDLYFSSMADLLASIRAHGVLPRPPFDMDRVEDYPVSAIRPLSSEVLERDVGAGLGPDGELYRVCPGLHRTAAALLLGVPAMPVELRLIHVNFLRKMMRDGEDVFTGIRRCIDFARAAHGAAAQVHSPATAAALPAHFRSTSGDMP